MATSAPAMQHTAIANLPNQLTILRLVLAVVLFVAMSWHYYLTALWLFLAAALTDWLDGFLARRYGLVTVLGRILDPFADKVVVCGTFIFLVSYNSDLLNAAHLRAWVVVVVVGRELLITALRSYLEQQGSDFSASFSGKLKMVAQCAAASVALYALHYEASSLRTVAELPQWLNLSLAISVWATVVLTVYSGAAYVMAAVRLWRG